MLPRKVKNSFFGSESRFFKIGQNEFSACGAEEAVLGSPTGGYEVLYRDLVAGNFLVEKLKGLLRSRTPEQTRVKEPAAINFKFLKE